MKKGYRQSDQIEDIRKSSRKTYLETKSPLTQNRNRMLVDPKMDSSTAKNVSGLINTLKKAQARDENSPKYFKRLMRGSLSKPSGFKDFFEPRPVQNTREFTRKKK